MGNSHSTPLLSALQELLGQRKLKIEKKILLSFLDECDRCAPWFIVSGSLTLRAWDKLGKDLDREITEGKLKPGTKPLWRMVRACLEDKRCEEAVRTGQKILTEQQESMSEGEKVSKGEKKRKGDKRNREKAEMKKGDNQDQETNKIYPSLKALTLGMSSDSELSDNDLADLEEEAAQYEKERYYPDWPHANTLWQQAKEVDKEAVIPTAPPAPLYNPQHKRMVKPAGGTSFCPEVWKEIGLSFPVFLDANGQRYHEPVDFKTIKQLAKSVKTYGVNTTFVIAQIEALGRYCLTPGDWGSLARACLSPGQYLDWKSYLYEYANIQAAINLASGADPQRHWEADMLLGIGRFALDQIGYPDQVYSQINEIAIKAWKALPNRGAVSGNLTKVLQGSTEPFSDFVARMVESATKVFGDPDTAMPLIKQLVYEQCTKECRTAITPYKHKGLEIWMKVCREIGGPLTNVGLAAAMIQLRKKVTADTCFKCGRKGHYRRQCPERSGKRGSNRPPQPRLCPCKKGNHWASECRSVKDLDGRLLATGYGGTQPKNGQRGPRPQGPQIYGALQKDRQGQNRGLGLLFTTRRTEESH